MAPTLALRWRVAGTAEAVSFAARDEIAVRSTVAAAPGTPLEGALDVPEGGPVPVTIKVRRCRREAAGGFLIEGRLVNPTKALRETLGQALGDGAGRGESSTGGRAE